MTTRAASRRLVITAVWHVSKLCRKSHDMFCHRDQSHTAYWCPERNILSAFRMFRHDTGSSAIDYIYTGRDKTNKNGNYLLPEGVGELSHPSPNGLNSRFFFTRINVCTVWYPGTCRSWSPGMYRVAYSDQWINMNCMALLATIGNFMVLLLSELLHRTCGILGLFDCALSMNCRCYRN